MGGVIAEMLSANGSEAGCRPLSKVIVILHAPAVMLPCFLWTTRRYHVSQIINRKTVYN